MVRKRIEDLEDSRRLELLVDAVVDYALYLIDLDGRVVTWNTGARRLKGYEAAEIIGEPYATFFTPEDRARGLPESALQVARKEGRFETEGWRVRKDGSRFWALAVVDAVRDESGEVIGFAKITRDMTQRERTRAELLEIESRFRQLVDGVIDYAIFQLDPNGIISTWNAGAQRISACSSTGERRSRPRGPGRPAIDHRRASSPNSVCCLIQPISVVSASASLSALASNCAGSSRK